MLEKPELTDAEIASCLEAGYGFQPACIRFLPLGQDVRAWRYRVDGIDGQSCFLKVRRPPVDELSLALPRFLNDCGVSGVVAPLPARNGQLWSMAAGFTVALYPFIDGRTGMESCMTPDQWQSLGAALRQLHASQLPDALAYSVPREQFAQPPRLLAIMQAVLAGQHESALSSNLEREVSDYLRNYRDEIQHILDRTLALGEQLQGRYRRFVLCHADIHINNVLIDGDGEVWIVDWDQPLFALPERDLMCVLGPAMRGVLPGSAEEASFYQGYGPVEINGLALTYYRYERALQDIAEYTEQIYWMPDQGEEIRRHAAQRLMRSFMPDKQAAQAFRADARLSDKS